MHKSKKLLIFIGDVAVFYLSLGATLLIRYGPDVWVDRLIDHLMPFSVILILWLVVMYIFNLYHYKTTKAESVLQEVGIAVGVATGLSMISFYFFPDFFQLTPKTNMVIFGGVFFALKYGWHNLALFKIFTKGAEKIVIIGNSPMISETALHIKDNPHIGFELEAWFDSPESLNFEKLSERIRKSDARLIVIQDHLAQKGGVSKLIYNLLTHEVNIMSFWNLYEIVFEKVPLDELEEGWFIENISAHRPFYDNIKRMIDVVFSLLMLIIFSPVMLAIAILVKFTSKGPAIFKQKRVGKEEDKFTLYKFRTMYEDIDGPGWTEENDSRVTPVGKFLRASHLDELPQLVNILKGDISLIGPRAESAELVEKYKNLPYYDMRHIIKPGFTGWAQLNYKPSASLEEAKEKLCYDLYYIKNKSIFLDLLIVIKTARLFFTNNK